jgi:hypothetical protein
MLPPRGSISDWLFLCLVLWCSLAAYSIALALLRVEILARSGAALIAGAAVIASVLFWLLPLGFLPWVVVPVFVAAAVAYSVSHLGDERLRFAGISAMSWATAILTLPLFGLYLLGLMRSRSLLGMDIYAALLVGVAAFCFLLASRNLWPAEWDRHSCKVVILVVGARAVLDLVRGDSLGIVLPAFALTIGTVAALFRWMSRRSGTS